MRVVAWEACTDAPRPAGLVVAGPLMAVALSQLRQRGADQLRQLSAVATRDLLVLIGADTALPWLDGARYCAPSPHARNLWIPTHLTPQLPTDLIESSLIERAGSSPVLLWHEPEQTLPLAGALTLTPTFLDWLTGELA